MYDPKIGRFSGRDPYGFVDGLLFPGQYFGLVSTDPTGEAITAGAALCIVGAAYLGGCAAKESFWDSQRAARWPTNAEKNCVNDMYKIAPKNYCQGPAPFRYKISTINSAFPETMCAAVCVDFFPGGKKVYIGAGDIDCTTCAGAMNTMMTVVHECVHVGQPCYFKKCKEFDAYHKSIIVLSNDRVQICRDMVATGKCKSMATCQANMTKLIASETGFKQAEYAKCLATEGQDGIDSVIR
jgi:hypothetical protein